MYFADKLAIPGEHSLTLPGLAGSIEAILSVPESSHSRLTAFLGHPHSLQGGTMNNKVVTTMARAFKELGIPSLRFNFRGVGQSAGTYDEGVGESDDMCALMQQWQLERPDSQFICAGFSFGSYVAYRSAARQGSRVLITIAPPVHHYDYRAFALNPNPWLVVQGDADEVVPAALVRQFAEESIPPLSLIECADTGHFFHGKLLELKALLIEYVEAQLA